MPPPTPLPPRLPAWNQPLTRPTSSGAVAWLMSASTAMPTTEFTRLAVAITRSMTLRVLATSGIAAISTMNSAERAVEITYQASAMSTMGLLTSIQVYVLSDVEEGRILMMLSPA